MKTLAYFVYQRSMELALPVLDLVERVRIGQHNRGEEYVAGELSAKFELLLAGAEAGAHWFIENDLRLESLAAALEVAPAELRKYFDASRQYWNSGEPLA
jgi:hypothetical protein